MSTHLQHQSERWLVRLNTNAIGQAKWQRAHLQTVIHLSVSHFCSRLIMHPLGPLFIFLLCLEGIHAQTDLLATLANTPEVSQVTITCYYDNAVEVAYYDRQKYIAINVANMIIIGGFRSFSFVYTWIASTKFTLRDITMRPNDFFWVKNVLRLTLSNHLSSYRAMNYVKNHLISTKPFSIIKD